MRLFSRERKLVVITPDMSDEEVLSAYRSAIQEKANASFRNVYRDYHLVVWQSKILMLRAKKQDLSKSWYTILSHAIAAIKIVEDVTSLQITFLLLGDEREFLLTELTHFKSNTYWTKKQLSASIVAKHLKEKDIKSKIRKLHSDWLEITESDVWKRSTFSSRCSARRVSDQVAHRVSDQVARRVSRRVSRRVAAAKSKKCGLYP